MAKNCIGLLLLALLLYFGCKKEQNDKLPDAGGTRLKKVLSYYKNASTYYATRFNYDDQNRLTQVIDTTPNSTDSTFLEYDTQNRLSAYRTKGLKSGTPYYESFFLVHDPSSKTTKKYVTTPAPFGFLEVYEYDEQNRIISHWGESGSAIFYFDYSYDERGNVKEKDWMVVRVSGKSTYQYDSALNPCPAVLYFIRSPLANLSKNNVVSEYAVQINKTLKYHIKYYSNQLPRKITFPEDAQISFREFYYE